MTFGGGEGLSPPPGDSPALELWFAQLLAELEELFEHVVPVYTDSTRPAAGTEGRVIFNSTDGQLNIDDGTNWTLPDGTTT